MDRTKSPYSKTKVVCLFARIFNITSHDIISGRRMKKERDTEENLVFSFLKFSAAKGSLIPLNTKQSLTQLCGK